MHIAAVLLDNGDRFKPVPIILNLFVIPAKAGIYEAIERTGFLLPQE